MNPLMFAMVDAVLRLERGRAWHMRRFRDDTFDWWRSTW